jgi:hypothetical protein
MELRDRPSRRRQHFSGSAFVSPAIPERTEDDRRKARNDQRDQTDAPRVHPFSVPHSAVALRLLLLRQISDQCGVSKRSGRAHLSKVPQWSEICHQEGAAHI